MALVAVCLTSFSLTSCNDDDDDTSGGSGKTPQAVINKLEGIWAITHSKEISKIDGVESTSYWEMDGVYYTFFSDGTFDYWESYGGEDAHIAGTYSSKNGVVTATLTEDDGDVISQVITFYGGDSLTMKYTYVDIDEEEAVQYTDSARNMIYAYTTIDSYKKIGTVPSYPKLIGTWEISHIEGWTKENGQITKEEDYDTEEGQYIRYYSNGICEEWGSDYDYWHDFSIWTTTGKNTIRHWYSAFDFGDFKILSLTDKELVLEWHDYYTSQGYTEEYYQKTTAKKVTTPKKAISTPSADGASPIKKNKHLFTANKRTIK